MGQYRPPGHYIGSFNGKIVPLCLNLWQAVSSETRRAERRPDTP